MYSIHYDSVTTAGPVRSVPYRSHELYPSSHTAAPQRMQSHSRGKKTKREDRPKSRTPSAEKIHSEAPEAEISAESGYTWRVRQLSDGSWEYYRHCYQTLDRAAPSKGSIADLNDPSTYLPGVSDWQTADVQPAVEAEVEVRISDDGGEYGVQDAYTNTSGLDQPLVNIEPGVDNWDREQQIQQHETSGYHSQHSTDYERPYYTKQKQKHATNKQKRRDSFSASSQKPTSLQWFFFPEESKQAVKQGQIRNNRVDLWLTGVPLEVAADIFNQGQYYAGQGKYETTAGYQ
ncbi:hypothetical protein V8F06_003517 [Rhypophila decipiens]